MKKLSIVAFAVALSFTLSVVLYAQSIAYPMKASIPFDFHVGDKMLHAGTYNVSTLNATGAIALRGSKDMMVVLSNSAVKPSTEKSNTLVFNHVNDNYFLSAIWTDGAGGYRVTTSKKERELMAQGANSEVNVLLASVN